MFPLRGVRGAQGPYCKFETDYYLESYLDLKVEIENMSVNRFIWLEGNY